MEQVKLGPLARGNCGDCGAPILFGHVMLCDECALRRLEATR